MDPADEVYSTNTRVWLDLGCGVAETCRTALSSLWWTVGDFNTWISYMAISIDKSLRFACLMRHRLVMRMETIAVRCLGIHPIKSRSRLPTERLRTCAIACLIASFNCRQPPIVHLCLGGHVTFSSLFTRFIIKRFFTMRDSTGIKWPKVTVNT